MKSKLLKVFDKKKVLLPFKLLNKRLYEVISTSKHPPELLQMKPLKLWYGCPIARWDHQCKTRVFAHTNHLPGVVCVSEEISRLRDRFIYGILAHEFGHEIAINVLDDVSEEGADEAAFNFLDLEIKYGSSLNLEYLNNYTIESLQE